MRGSVRGASGNRCPYRDCYYWPVLGDRDEVVFHFAPSRAHHHVARFLGDFEGTLVSDGYGAYAAYAEARGEAVRQQNCWSHTRRNFEEQLDNHPVFAGKALDLIGGMYGIEKEFRTRPPPERLEARRTRTRLLVDAFWQWCERTLGDPALTPKHPIRRAVTYAVERQQALEVFLEDPLVPIDSNGVERALRRIKLGQKNWLFPGQNPAHGTSGSSTASSPPVSCSGSALQPIWAMSSSASTPIRPTGSTN